jgi:hypothetical protein
MPLFRWFRKEFDKDDEAEADKGRPETAKEKLDRLVRPARRDERMLVEFARELLRAGECAWDLGPDRGYFAAAAAILCGPSGAVTAVEPNPKRAAALRDVAENLGRNVARIEVLETGTGDRIVLGDTAAALPRQVNFEWLIRKQRRPHVVRVSLAMSDGRLWSGAERLMGEVRPILLFEVQPAIVQALGRRLRHHGYEIFDAEKNPSDRLRLVDPVRYTLAMPITTARDEDREV